MQILCLSLRQEYDSNKLKSASFKPTNGVYDNRSVNMAIVNGFYSDLLHFRSLDLWLIELASIAHCCQLNQRSGPTSCADPSHWEFWASNGAQETLPGCSIKKQKHARQPNHAAPLHPSWRCVSPLSTSATSTSGRGFTPVEALASSPHSLVRHRVNVLSSPIFWWGSYHSQRWRGFCRINGFCEKSKDFPLSVSFPWSWFFSIALLPTQLAYSFIHIHSLTDLSNA